MRHKVVENLSSTCTVVPSAELCLHGGMAFGRTLKLLHPTEDKEAKDLKKKLDEVVPLEPLQGRHELYSCKKITVFRISRKKDKSPTTTPV